MRGVAVVGGIVAVSFLAPAVGVLLSVVFLGWYFATSRTRFQAGAEAPASLTNGASSSEP